MEQMKIDPSLIVDINYEDTSLPAHVRNFRPVIFQDGNLVYCFLGPNMQEGILGLGESIAAAMQDWEQKLQERIAKPSEDDQVAREILDNLSISKKDVW